MDSKYDGPAALVENGGTTAPLTVRLWSVNPSAAHEPGRWGGDIERLDGEHLPRPIFSSGSESLVLRLPDGSEGRCTIDYYNVASPAEAEVKGVGLPPF